MKKILLAAIVLVLASCGEVKYGNEKLETGTYSVTEPEFGTVCVDILDKKNCDVYFPGESVYHGTYDIDGASLHIKGYAERPHDKAVAGTVTENWRVTCTFTLGVGSIQSPTSFTYQCSIRQASGYSGDAWLNFAKR